MNSSQKVHMELRGIKIVLIAMFIPLVVLVLKALDTIFIPLIFAIFLSFVFAPMRSWLSKHNLPFWLNMLLMLVVILIAFVSLGFIIFAAGTSFVEQLPKYQTKMAEQFQYVWDLNDKLSKKLEHAFAMIPGMDPASFFSGGSFSITGFASKAMATFMSAGSQIFLTLVFLLFLVGGAGKMGKRVHRVLTDAENQQTFEVLISIQNQIQRYFVNKTLISFCAASIAMLIKWAFGVDFVIVAGLFYFALSFIPNIGSFISTLFPITICLLQYGFGYRLVALILLLIGTEVFFGNYVEPRVMSRKVDLSPIMVLISLIFWAYVWGIVGMMIAVPITSSINIILKRINEKSVISAVISDS